MACNKAESGILNLQTGMVTDDTTGVAYCKEVWETKLTADANQCRVKNIVASIDITSDIQNVPGKKPYYGRQTGLIREDDIYRTESMCGRVSGKKGLSGY